MGEVIKLNTTKVLERKVRALMRNDEVLHVDGDKINLRGHVSSWDWGPCITLCSGPLPDILEWLELRAKVDARAKARKR